MTSSFPRESVSESSITTEFRIGGLQNAQCQPRFLTHSAKKRQVVDSFETMSQCAKKIQ